MANWTATKNVMRVCSFIYPPYQLFPRTGYNAPLEGLSGKILSSVFRSMNFNHILIEPSEKTWGEQLPNGRFTGMAGAIQNDLADITMGPTNPTAEKLELAHVSEALHPVILVILSGRLKSYQTNLFSIITNLGWQLWGLLLLAFALYAIVMMAATFGTMSFWNMLKTYPWLLFQAMTSQSSEADISKTNAFRILFGFWLLAMLVVTNLISGQIKAAFLAKQELPRIDSVEDVAKGSNIIPFTINGSAITFVLEHSPKAVHQNVFKRMQKMDSAKTNALEIFGSNNMNLVLQGKAVIIASIASVAQKSESQCAKMSRGEFYTGRIPVVNYLCIFQINRKLDKHIVDGINARIRYLREGGFIAKWHREINGEWTSCGETTQLTALDVSDFTTIFMAIGVLLAFATLTLILEIIASKAFA